MTDVNELVEQKGIEHIDVLGTLSHLRELGFEGPDRGLDTSLFEYGWAWKQLDEDEYLFVYGIHMSEWSETGELLWDRFDRCSIDLAEYFDFHFDWADYEGIAVARYENEPGVGSDPEECLKRWKEEDLLERVMDLHAEHGNQIFGESCWEGFAIKDTEHVASGQSEFPCPRGACDGYLLMEELRVAKLGFGLRGWDIKKGDEFGWHPLECRAEDQAFFCDVCGERFAAREDEWEEIQDVGDVLENIYESYREPDRREGWVETDRGTGQWMAENTDGSFDVYEEARSDIQTYNPQSMSYEELDEAVSGYYDSITDLRERAPISWPKLVAEILSEKRLAPPVIVNKQKENENEV